MTGRRPRRTTVVVSLSGDGMDALPSGSQRVPLGSVSARFTRSKESGLTHDGDGLFPMAALFGFGWLGTHGHRFRDIPTGAVRLNRSGGGLPPFDLRDVFGEWAEQFRHVGGLGVAGGLAEPVLMPPHISLQAGPGGDLILVAGNPFVAAALECDKS